MISNQAATDMDVSRLSLTLGLMLLSGCATGPGARTGGLVGTGLGAGTGAIIGHQSGQTREGAIIGAIGGAVVGTAVGDGVDARAERDAAIAHANASVVHRSLNNDQLIRMAQAGLGDEVIINSIQTDGGQFDLSPNGLI